MKVKLTPQDVAQRALIQNRLLEITVGKTTTINGIAATRWSESTFEVGTWGKTNCTLQQAAVRIMFA